MSFLRLTAGLLISATLLIAQVPDAKSLSGKYFFRELIVAGAAAQAASLSGTLTFTGSGAFTYQGQQVTGTSGPVTVSGSGTYSVSSSGSFVLGPDPLQAGTALNGRIGNGALVASNTESGLALYDLLIAIPAPANKVTNAALSGTYWMATLELPSGAISGARDAFVSLTADGNGRFGDVPLTGEINGAGEFSQTAAGSTYSLNSDGSGTVNFPSVAGTDTNGLVLSGTKNIYVSQDGSIFIGGGTTAGGQGIVIGIKTAVTTTNSTLTGIYFGAGLNASGATNSSFVGAANAIPSSASLVWSRRYVQTGYVKPLNISAVNTYGINSGGSGFMLSDSLAVSANGNFFLASGVEPPISTGNLEIVFGVQAPALSGTGLFLNPLGVFNSASYAVGSPISEGELLTLYGTGFPTQTAVAAKLPLAATLGGVQVLINGTAIPMFAVTSDHVSGIVPYGLGGISANIVATSAGKSSNSVTVPVAATAPGIFTAASNGLGPAAILHADYTLVSTASPARAGETVQIFLTGLGAVNPAVTAGTAAPSNPLSVGVGPLAIYIDGVAATFAFQGLAPTLAALYQINVVVPATVGGGSLPLAIQTADGFTDEASIPVR